MYRQTDLCGFDLIVRKFVFFQSVVLARLARRPAVGPARRGRLGEQALKVDENLDKLAGSP